MDKQREMFEAWYSKHCEPGAGPWFVREASNPDEYYMSHTQTAWDAWLAALASQWRQIETAPKDGQAILVSDGMFRHCVEWNDEFDWWAVDDNKLGPFRLRGAAPTHWMPLPPEPAK